jgi:hypothetical protein
VVVNLPPAARLPAPPVHVWGIFERKKEEKDMYTFGQPELFDLN